MSAGRAGAAPFGLPTPSSRLLNAGFASLAGAARASLVFLRALPEYVWAFLLLAVLGPTPWPLVLALAIHNAGVLGRLNAEVIENADLRPLRALRLAGATRGQVASWGLVTPLLSRFLLFFFYRWESCVRDATVLGMLTISSLGYWIDEYRARMEYDGFVTMILLGSALVLAGDLVSALARRIVRRAD